MSGGTYYDIVRCWVRVLSAQWFMNLTLHRHESTASTFVWATYLLSINEDVQTRLREEIYKTIPDPGGLQEPGCQIGTILETMPYLNSVCNEVLRLFPTLPLSARVAVRDTTVASHFVPVGTLVLISPWAINRNPELWGEDSEEFVPERWIDDNTGRMMLNGSAASKYSLLTFFHGPRSCIGERFARAELRALVTAFVGSFKMQMSDPSEVVVVGGSLTAKPVNGMRLKLTPTEWCA
jgi:cytochrome P450